MVVIHGRPQTLLKVIAASAILRPVESLDAAHYNLSEAIAMHAYLAAHDDFVTWLDTITEAPPSSDVEHRLWALAVTAAARGMSSTHWTFVVDGLVAYCNRLRPGDILLSSNVARGFDLAARWKDVQLEAERQQSPRMASFG